MQFHEDAGRLNITRFRDQVQLINSALSRPLELQFLRKPPPVGEFSLFNCAGNLIEGAIM